MRGRLVLAGAMLLIGALVAQAEPVARDRLPAELARDLGGLDAICTEAGGIPGDAPDLLTAADLTGDGFADYVVDVNLYNCQGAASALTAGNDGAAMTIYLGGPKNTARDVFATNSYGVRVVSDDGRPRVWLDVAGADCGQKHAGDLPISDWKFCSRPLDWEPAKRTFAFAPLSEIRPIK